MIVILIFSGNQKSYNFFLLFFPQETLCLVVKKYPNEHLTSKQQQENNGQCLSAYVAPLPPAAQCPPAQRAGARCPRRSGARTAVGGLRGSSRAPGGFGPRNLGLLLPGRPERGLKAQAFFPPLPPCIPRVFALPEVSLLNPQA